jgi:hypothetical protein
MMLERKANDVLSAADLVQDVSISEISLSPFLSCQSPDGGAGEQLAVANFWPRIALIYFASAPFLRFV